VSAVSKTGSARPHTEAEPAKRAKPAGVWKALLKPVLNSAARRALVGRRRSALRPEAGRFSRSDVDRVLRRLWRRYDELSPGIPRQPTLGTRMNVRLAAATVAAHGALVEAGVEEDEAADLVADIAWVVYEKWGSIPKLISRIATRNPLRRMAIATSLFRRFPFNPPGYVMEDVPADDLVAFDVRHCPVSDFFRSQGLPGVCVAAWCNQDYSLAELWGGKFERGGTLVQGAERCDMRWLPGEAGS
jgi:hypothetical protein